MVTVQEISEIWLGEPRNAIETKLAALCAMMPTLMRYLRSRHNLSDCHAFR